MQTGATKLASACFATIAAFSACFDVAFAAGPFVQFEATRYLQSEMPSASVTVRGQQPELPGQEVERRRRSPFETLFTTPGEEPSLDVIPISDVSADIFRQEEGQLNADPSIGGQIQKSTAAPSVGFQRRSPISQDPHIRGYRWGQIYTQADGQHWLPVRLDLDSMMSRFDPSLVQDIAIINGPYGLRYGPGFSFINIKTVDTPRHDVYQASLRTGLSVHTNGGQVYGRETVYGGSSNWGFIFNYGNRTGADYRPGSNAELSRIPGSYHDQSFLGQIGYDLSENCKIEFRASRLDQTDTEYAGQFFDVGYLVTDSFSATLTRVDPCRASEFKAEAWYNRSRFAGDTRNPSKRSSPTGSRYFPVIDRVERAIEASTGATGVTLEGDTDGNVTSAGFRAGSTYGDADWLQLRLGGDVRYVEQHLFEQFATTGTNVPAALQNFMTNMPQAEMVNPGMFAELTLPWLPYLRSAIGGRVDWVTSDAREGGLPDGLRTSPPDASASSLPGAPGTLPQNDVLAAFFLRNELEITSNWTAELSVGYAERSPTLLERYADGIFVGVIQSGFTRLIGDPTLRKERLWQVDAGVKADFDWWRGNAAFFYAWVHDYATYTGFAVPDPTGARLVQSANTDLATLVGFEMKGEFDLLERVSMIGTLNYVQGDDREIDRALPGIMPLECRIAMRLRDDSDGALWGMEFGTRMVNGQDRVGWLRLGQTGSEFTVEQATPGFTTCYLRGYLNVTEDLNIYAGVENLFDRTYIEHLDLRLPDDPPDFQTTPVLSPGITPYISVEWTY